MNLFPFLSFSVVFCALVMVVNSQGSRTNKIAPTVLIAAEVYLLLLVEGIFDAPFGYESTFRTVGCAIVAVAALVDFLRLQEKAFPLLAVYAGLVQLLVSLGVVEGVSI